MLRTSTAFAFSLVTLLANAGTAHADDSARIAELKAQIRSIAIENLGRRDNLPETRALLEPLALELAKFHTPADAAADLPALEGAWKEIFSDDVEPEPPGFSTVRDEVYQVITTNGYFYNFGNLAGPGPLKVLGLLRGEYAPTEDFLNIEFTKVSIRPRPLKSGEVLMDVVEKLESGDMFTITPPGNNRAPKGPVGAKGNIKNLFIDGDFRVATGSNFADGKFDLYVLDKVTTPISYK
ncbi:MAG: hypothetical protein IOD12_17735 [Silvanigrellales bacterium]|jgi:hypothetical protein|nr:hypothetical protein [Silvanigrellales bacterium]